MTFKLASIACLLVGACIAATVPKPRVVTITEAGTFSLQPTSDAYLPATLKATCKQDGAVEVTLTSVAPQGIALINLGTGTPAETCQNSVTFPKPVGDQWELSIADAVTCGIAELEADGVFSWPLTVIQTFPGVGDSARPYTDVITLECSIGGLSVEEFEADNLPVPEVVPVAVNSDLIFNIVKGTTNFITGKWIFTLKPAETLDGTNFQIVSCTASAPASELPNPRLSAVLIEKSCILDSGTTVDIVTATEPNDGQTISVSIFQFTANPTASVTFSCNVRLCTTDEPATGRPLCPTVAAFGAPCPANPETRFQRSVAEELYEAAVKW